MKDIKHGFGKTIYTEIQSLPIDMLVGEADDVLNQLKKILKQAKKKYPKCTNFAFVPDGIDFGCSAHVISARGAVPDQILEPGWALAEIVKSKTAMPADNYGRYLNTLKLIGIQVVAAEDVRECPQSKEERKALEQRERALLSRLKEKYEKED